MGTGTSIDKKQLLASQDIAIGMLIQSGEVKVTEAYMLMKLSSIAMSLHEMSETLNRIALLSDPRCK